MRKTNGKRRFRVRWQGLVFAYGLKRRRLVLALFRVVPIAWVAYDDMVYVRQRSGEDLRRALVPGRSWYWPHAIFLGRPGFDHAPYVVRTKRGARIFVRLRHDFHYLLREMIGRARAANQPQT